MIRPVRQEDKETWVALNAAFYKEENEGSDDPRSFEGDPAEHFSAAFDAVFGQPGCALFFWEEGGKPVAFATFVTYPSVWAKGLTLQLDDLYVLPEARRKGIGSRLMEHLDVYAEEVGATRFQLLTEPHNPAGALYRSQGFCAMPMLFMLKYPREEK